MIQSFILSVCEFIYSIIVCTLMISWCFFTVLSVFSVWIKRHGQIVRCVCTICTRRGTPYMCQNAHISYTCKLTVTCVATCNNLNHYQLNTHFSVKMKTFILCLVVGFGSFRFSSIKQIEMCTVENVRIH